MSVFLISTDSDGRLKLLIRPLSKSHQRCIIQGFSKAIEHDSIGFKGRVGIRKVHEIVIQDMHFIDIGCHFLNERLLVNLAFIPGGGGEHL